MTSPLCPDVLTRSLRRIPRPAVAALLSAFVCGVLVYGFAMFNMVLCTSDALANVEFNGNLVWLGRWSSVWLSALSSDTSLPAINTLLMILAVTLAAGFAASLLDIQSTFMGALFGAVMMCFPSVGSILKYLHNADAYMIAALLAVASLWLADRRPMRGWAIAAIPLLAVAVGTYQATLSLAVALMFVRGVQRILRGEDDNRTLLGVLGRYAALFVGGVILYYVMVKVSTALSGIPLTEYQSTSRMGQFTLAELGANFVGCFRDFKQAITFLSFRPGYYVNGYPNYLLVGLCIGLIGLCFWLSERKTWLKGLVLALLTALSPMLLCAIRLANPGSVESRMTYSVVGLYLLAIVLIEQLSALWQRIRTKRLLRLCSTAASWTVTAILILAVFVWSVGINRDLYDGKQQYERMYDHCSNYLARVESTEGYQQNMPIYIIGLPQNTPRPAPGLHQPKSYYAFMLHYMNVSMPYGIANDIDDAAKAIQATEAFQMMPCWPESGSVACLDGAMVVKLSD